MHRHQLGVCLSVFLVVLGTAGSTSSFAGSVNVVGWVVTSRNASTSGDPVSQGQTVLSGQELEVGREGRVLLELGHGNRMMLRENTVVSFERQGNDVSAAVSLGEVAISQTKDHTLQVHVKLGKTSVTPGAGYYSSGKVVVTKQLTSVATKEGSLRLEGAGHVLDVPQGKVAMLTKDSAESAMGLHASALHETLPAAGFERSSFGSKPEDSDCDRDDRSISPHKPPKCVHD